MDEIMDKTCPSVKFSFMDQILFPRNLSPNKFVVSKIILFQLANFFSFACAGSFELDKAWT